MVRFPPSCCKWLILHAARIGTKTSERRTRSRTCGSSLTKCTTFVVSISAEVSPRSSAMFQSISCASLLVSIDLESSRLSPLQSFWSPRGRRAVDVYAHRLYLVTVARIVCPKRITVWASCHSPTASCSSIQSPVGRVASSEASGHFGGVHIVVTIRLSD